MMAQRLLIFRIYVILIWTLLSARAWSQENSFLKIEKSEGSILLTIPRQLLGRDFMLVTRMRESAYQLNKGDILNENILRWERNSAGIKLVEMLDKRQPADAFASAVYRRTYTGNFPIKDEVGDALAVELRDWVNDDGGHIFLLQVLPEWGEFLQNESLIDKIFNFPDHLEIQSTRVYKDKYGIRRSFRLSTVIHLMPVQPMLTRSSHPFLSYFEKVTCADSADNPNTKAITRWRLSPKKDKVAAYLKGDIVEVEHPIVFYLDEEVPSRWASAIIRGVESWQRSFEKIGFKNAIVCKPALRKDSGYSTFTTGKNSIFYIENEKANAQAVVLVDPRSGEIMQAQMGIFKGSFNWDFNTYLVLGAGSDTNISTYSCAYAMAEKMVEMMVAHEIGHALGMSHNQLASAAVPVEKLRDTAWLAQNGITPSIMDYARVNYVAQRGDPVDLGKGMINRIGVFDDWAVEYGYKWYGYEAPTEKQLLQQLIDGKKDDKRFAYLNEAFNDPRMALETLGDDALTATRYGFANLNYSLSQIDKWTSDTTVEVRKQLYKDWWTQYEFMLRHVSGVPGGLYVSLGVNGDTTYTLVDSTRQQAAIDFLIHHLADGLFWSGNGGLVEALEKPAQELVEGLQERTLYEIMNEVRLRNVMFYGQKGEEAKALNQYFYFITAAIDKASQSVGEGSGRASLLRVYIAQLQAILTRNAQVFQQTYPAISKSQSQKIYAAVTLEMKRMKATPE